MIGKQNGFLPMPLDALNRQRKGCAGPSFMVDAL
jgi:hypothetical protein